MTKRQSGSQNEQSHSEPGQELPDSQAQQDQQGAQTPGSSEQQRAGAAQRGTMNKPGDANESGSEGSTRRDDGAAVKGR